MVNHDRIKLCKSRQIPAWLKKCQEQLEKGEDVLQEKGGTIKDRKYCICRGPDTGEMMIQCDSCKEWYHLTCVSLTPNEAEALDSYTCPNCQNVSRDLSS